MARDVFDIVGTTQAGNFVIERVVAEGGFGVVYKARHTSFRAPVALKFLKVPESMGDEAREHFFERFRSEGELLFRLSQAIPEVVRPLHVDVLELGGRPVPFLALEWLEGETLDRVIARRRSAGQAPLGVYQTVKLLAPIAAALARAHRFPGPDGDECVVHRDLKPENIFLARIAGGEAPKILDFGIARAKSAAAHEAGRITDGDAPISFTPGYAAPEQWLPKRYGKEGPWTDVYGLAMTLVEVLTGRAPIEGDLAAMMGTTIDPVHRPTPRAGGVDIDDRAEAAFTHALVVDPRSRAQTIEAFWTPLEKALGMPSTLRSISKREPVGLAGAVADGVDGVDAGAPTIDLPLPAAPPPPLVRRPAIPDLEHSPSPARSPRAKSQLVAPDDDDGRFVAQAFEGALATARPKILEVPAGAELPPIDRFAPPPPTIYERIKPGLFYMQIGIAILVVDVISAYFVNEPLALFGVHLAWLAAPILAIGVGVGLWRLVTPRE